ncbi:MAG: phage tail tape measure protein [Clostridia bacterium]|nr:phage tail tape measure protein [Clostridia bacterium]
MAVEIPTNVVLNGQTTEGFNALAGKLEALGATVDKIGSAVRDFEEESVDTYRHYDDNMRATRAALLARYKSATELSQVMDSLDEHAHEWAKNTIFHTSDVSDAILEAARASWSYDEIVKGLPQAMLIAQAGSMDLSSGLDYLTRMIKTTGTSFDDMDVLIDQWAKAANLSATSIDEMGEAFMSLSASAMFADNTQELFTMLAVLADAGITGTQAGTLLRNAMMRVVAPTQKAKEAMAELGATEEELEAWTGASDTAVQLEELGFSAYDAATGELKPMKDILTGIHDALSGMTEVERFDILSTIFPLRSINAATAFYNAIENGHFDELYTAIGDSEGYAAKGAEIMMGGLTGAIELLASKWEEFQLQVGEVLAPWIEKVAGWLGEIMDAVNGMDEATLSGLVGSMTALAELGPVMLGAGGIIKAVSTLGLKGTLLVGAVMAAGALYGYFSKLNEINFESNFGKMELDLDTLGQHVNSLKTTFDGQLETISTWEAALEAAESKYATTSSKLSETLLTDVLTGKQLTDAEKKNLFDYAQSLYDAVWEGIENAEASDMTFLDAIFGDHENVEQENVGNTAAQVVTSWYESLYGEARAVGEELRNQMTAALQDGSLNEAERQAIQASVDRYNQIMAEIQSQMDAEAYYEQLYKAQSVSWDSISSYIEENTTKQESDLAALEDAYAAKWAHYRAAYQYALENGTEITDLEGNTFKITEDNFDSLWGAFEEQFKGEKEKAQQGILDKYGSLSMAAFMALMNDSDYGDAWKMMQRATFRDDGSIDLTDMFAGMSQDELSAANQSLSKLWENADRIAGRLPRGFFETDQGMQMYRLMEYAGQAASEASQWNTNLWMYGLDAVPTQAQMDVWSKQGQIAELQAKLERTEADIAAAQARMKTGDYPILNGAFGTNSYYKDWTLLNGTNGNGGGLLDQKAQIELDISAAEAELAVLEEKANQPQEMPVVADLNTSAVDNYTPPTKYMPVIAQPQYAYGGRATTASIFGEAGPEWAIPEEHTERTAELLNAAREASGFSWGDLLGRFGGLNANPNNQSVVVHYSPTINAQDARGVADVLAADKSRLLKMVKDMLAEQRLRDEVEVYA